MNNANMPAMPQTFAINDAGDIESSQSFDSTCGLTKREYFAGLAMQSVLNNYNPYEQGDFDSSNYEVTAKNAVGLADALLKQLEDK